MRARSAVKTRHRTKLAFTRPITAGTIVGPLHAACFALAAISVGCARSGGSSDGSTGSDGSGGDGGSPDAGGGSACGVAPGPEPLQLCSGAGPVGSSGHALVVGPGEAYSSINAAIADANPGDTIYIRGGTYNEFVEVNRGGTSESERLVIRRFENEDVTIVGRNDATHYGHAVRVTAPWVTVYGLSVRADPDWSDDRAQDYIVWVEGDAQHLALSCLDLDGGPDWKERWSSSSVGGVTIRGVDVQHQSVIEGVTFRRIPGSPINLYQPTHVIVRGNTARDYWGNFVMLHIDPDRSDGRPRRVVIEHNWFGGSLRSDGVQTNAYIPTGERFVSHFVIRNNIMHGFGENAIDLKGAARVLVEGNIIQGATGDNDGSFHDPPDRNTGPAIHKGSNTIADHWIVRRNLVYDNCGGVNFSWGMTNMAVYNNTIVANNRDFTGPDSSFAPPSWTNGRRDPLFVGGKGGSGGDGEMFRNNIVGQHSHAELSLPISLDELDIDHNVYFNTDGPVLHLSDGDNTGETHDIVSWRVRLLDLGASGWDEHSVAATASPGFADVPDLPSGAGESTFDFRLTASSAARDAGGPLTTTSNAGFGREIPVENAYPFYDGMGIPGELGDLILVGSAAPVRIESVDLSSSRIMVDSDITWSVGAPVFLAGFEGTAPDAGAFEYCP